MSSLTEFFEQYQRRLYVKPRSMWPVIAYGLLFLVSGLVVAVLGSYSQRAAWMLLLGFAVASYGITETVPRGSPWRWATRVAVFVIWVATLWFSLHRIGYW